MKKIIILFLLIFVTGCNNKEKLINVTCYKTNNEYSISYNITYNKNNDKISKIVKNYHFVYDNNEEALNNSDNICDFIQQFEYKDKEKYDECNIDIKNNNLYVERVNINNIDRDYKYYKKYFKDNKYMCK